MEAVNFETDEALLTGESLPVQKECDAIFKEDTGPGDRLNIAYSSSTVSRGRSLGVAVATGMSTEIGSIAAALRASGKKIRPVKRGPEGEAKKRWYVQAWTLTGTDAIGRFLGINIGTPLQRKLSKLAVLLFVVAIIFAIIVEASNGFSSNNQVILYAVGTGLSMIPACLVVVLTITMAVGTRRMVERNVIVRKLDSLEALGAVTDICSDKTGTLTQGKMVVKKAWIPSRGTYSVGSTSEPFNPTVGDVTFSAVPPLQFVEEEDGKEVDNPEDMVNENHALEDFLNVASMANLAHVYKSDEKDEWHARGEPTEIAIQVFASKFNWNNNRWTKGLGAVWHQKAEFPFDSSVKKMSVIFTKGVKQEEQSMVFSKGAVERILDACSTVVWDQNSTKPVTMTDEYRSLIIQNMDDLAKRGLRVLALAHKPFNSEKLEILDESDVNREQIEKDLCFLGLIGLYDPPRPETEGSVTACRNAGIAVHMVTGDHPGTAKAIAQQVGIVPADLGKVSADVANAMVMAAGDFDKLSDEEIDALPTLPLVVARCAPQTKVRMIDALHRRGRFAAMTGDGVNDSPSLKHADVGIAMGQAGSDVAKDASDIVLTDDNFASIINAIEEGRRIFDNIQKFVLHLLSENIAQAATLLIGLAFKDGTNQSVFPLAPVEIMWVIMITGSLPEMGLGREIAAPDIMNRPPQSKQGIFTWEIIIDILVYGLWNAALCLASFSIRMWGFGDGDLAQGCNGSRTEECELVFRARATTFVCLTWFALFLAWEMVNLRRSFFCLRPNSTHFLTQWAFDIWQNKFLFWSVIAGFATIFPILYIPVINDKVFKHAPISWEWGIVFIETGLFILGIEAWKWAKRVFFRRMGKKGQVGMQESV